MTQTGEPQVKPYAAQVALRWSDMDAYAHINNVQFLRLLEDARVIAF
ncbi:MAG: thioesterase family protein, partial [Terrabacter sp.]